MTLDVLFQSIGSALVSPHTSLHDLAQSDRSEAQILTASSLLESMYGDAESRINSRAQTPMPVSISHSPSQLQKNPCHFQPPLRKVHQFPTRMKEHSSKSYSGIARFHLSKLYSSLKGKPTAETTSTHMPGEFPRDPSEEQDENSARPTPSLGTVTRSMAKVFHSPVKDSTVTPIHLPPPLSRRGPPRASTLPTYPSIDSQRAAVDESCEYAIVISMYEVYNDRIFDLLTSPSPNLKHLAKDARRRPLLFKCTEYSPDRKVVAGLRKVVCGSLDEALLILETGLTERRVAGTGSNAVSSRSHGFFCVEVKKKPHGSRQPWSSATMTIVDLAGSERARNAKTAGATLAEAGKINESLMYLGQCMQMQSDNAQLSATADPHLVPFRQCKLTELLFSNVFTQRGGAASGRMQKATMIVTADPRGDFNATSQILRYSALAREVTVPRIPSVTQTIMYPSLSHTRQDVVSPTMSEAGRTSPTLTNNTADEVASLQMELEVLRMQLTEETERRKAAEEAWARASAKTEDAIEEAEAAVRAECMDAFELQLAMERARFVDARDEEREANERLIDDKVDLLRSATEVDEEDGRIAIYEDGWQEKCELLEREHEDLQGKFTALEGELRKLRNLETRGTPSRKLKTLEARKWEAVGDEENEEPLPVV